MYITSQDSVGYMGGSFLGMTSSSNERQRMGGTKGKRGEAKKGRGEKGEQEAERRGRER